jgi:hypothetical protein
MLYMTTSRKHYDPAKWKIKVLGHAAGMAHEHYLVEVADTSELIPLIKRGVECGEVKDEQEARRYLAEHPTEGRRVNEHY